MPAERAVVSFAAPIVSAVLDSERLPWKEADLDSAAGAREHTWNDFCRQLRSTSGHRRYTRRNVRSPENLRKLETRETKMAGD